MARGGIRSDHCDSSRYERGSVDSALSLGQKRARNEANLKQEDQKSPSNTGHPLRENRFFFFLDKYDIKKRSTLVQLSFVCFFKYLYHKCPRFLRAAQCLPRCFQPGCREPGHSWLSPRIWSSRSLEPLHYCCHGNKPYKASFACHVM